MSDITSQPVSVTLESVSSEAASENVKRDTKRGVYILANDVVLDQLIALINSLEENVSANLPICVVPYDDNTSHARAATQQYDQVEWFDDAEILTKWENFSTQSSKAVG